MSSDGAADAGRVLRLAAVAAMPTIRIGVVQSASSLTLGSAGDYVVTDKANGLEIVRGSGDGIRRGGASARSWPTTRCMASQTPSRRASSGRGTRSTDSAASYHGS